MGDNYLEAQAKNTRKRRAIAAEEIESPKLFVRPDRVTERYTVDCVGGGGIDVGEELTCYPGGSDGVIDVVRGHLRVGEVGPHGGGLSLEEDINDEGVGRLRVVSIDPIGGSAEVETFKEDLFDEHRR